METKETQYRVITTPEQLERGLEFNEEQRMAFSNLLRNLRNENNQFYELPYCIT